MGCNQVKWAREIFKRRATTAVQTVFFLERASPTGRPALKCSRSTDGEKKTTTPETSWLVKLEEVLRGQNYNYFLSHLEPFLSLTPNIPKWPLGKADLMTLSQPNVPDLGQKAQTSSHKNNPHPKSLGVQFHVFPWPGGIDSTGQPSTGSF